MRGFRTLGAISSTLLLLNACLSEEPAGIAVSQPALTTVVMDFEHRPLPEIPLPNDIATRYDPTSATGRRVNASMLAPTEFESRVRTLLDRLDGWGVYQPITIPFSGPLHVASIVAGHSDTDFDTSNDVIYLIDVDPSSPERGKVHPLDIGQGNYPIVLERREYWRNDPRHWLISILFDEEDEDRDGDGLLDLGGDADGNGLIEGDEWPEDSDADGVLDKPNYLPWLDPPRDDLAARADALMSFYERETNTLIARVMEPLRERTTYAVVVTRRLRDVHGIPVGSPYPFVNHGSQTEALSELPELLPEGLRLDDVAFTFTFTTQSTTSYFKAVRDGLYGHGVQAHLAQEFPAELAGLEQLHEDGKVDNPYIFYAEPFNQLFALIAEAFLGAKPGAEADARFDALKYIDFHVIGTIESPQLFPRAGDDGEWLPLNLQSWPEDLDRVAAPARRETLYFWLIVPRKEVSVRGEGKPAPMVIVGHGYGGTRFDVIDLAGHFAKFGMAVMAIDCVSHGLGLSQEEIGMAQQIFDMVGEGPLMAALLKGRGHDQNNDGIVDSGADFWSTYLFHTRDVVRQSTLDYMSLVRVFRSFDGQRRWRFDLDGDGENELAGDFDADGVVDVGGDAYWTMTGASLGGMMTSMVAGLEPSIVAAAPIAGGAGLGDIGIRSQQGGVREAFILRTLGPLYAGQLEPDSGALKLATIVPDLNDTADIAIGEIPGARPGDTLVGVNLVSDERGCGYVNVDGQVRLSLPSDAGDPIELRLYRGPSLAAGEDCPLRDGAELVGRLDAFGVDVEFQGHAQPAGTELTALTEGFGLPRATPGLRRMTGIAQAVIDPGDPGVYARHLLREPLTYPGTRETTGAHTLVITTMGDMNVPASSGATYGRAAGLLEWRIPDARYGHPVNQELIETFALEAVHSFGRFRDDSGTPVHIDLESFSDDDPWAGDGIPRHPEPLRHWGPDELCHVVAGKECGISGSMWPWPRPDGQHGFAMPGAYTDAARKRCQQECQEAGESDCGCQELEPFDIGFFMFNMLGRYFATQGTELPLDLCSSRNDCDYIPPPPPARSF